MLYLLEQGPTESKIIEMSHRQGLPLPDAIINKPTIRLGLELFYAGFLDLSDERQTGFGLGPIPWRAMSEYCHAHGIEGEQLEDFFFHVKKMDAAFLKHSSEKQDKST